MVAHVLTGGPHLDILDEAVRTRTAVQFTYHDKLREVQGWKIIQRFGFYYFLGFEQSTGPRIFKLARIQSQAELVGNSGAFDSPAPRDIDELVASLEGPEPTRSVRVALRDFTAGHLRRRGVTVEGEAPLGYELVEIPYARLDEIISSLCEVGPDALVMDPGEVRDGVLAHMRFWQGRI
jgi:proteasome accessory factor B